MRSEILQLDRFGEKSFTNLAKSIIQSKQKSLERLLFGLGINHVGQKTALILAKKYQTLSNLMQATFTDLANTNDIGPTIATSIVDYFSNENNLQLVKKLMSYKINDKYIGSQQTQVLNNKTFVLTGTLTKSRTEVTNLLASFGAKITNSISNNTNYLIVGTNPGHKLAQAQKLNVKIITEQQLENLLKEVSKND